MAYRNLNGKQYPIPGVDTALATLRPGCKWEMQDLEFLGWEHESEPPTEDEIKAEILREVDVYQWYEYEREREPKYPPLKDQLDMLYKDIKSGNLENGDWVTAIDAIKQSHPKPEGEPPAWP